MCVCVRACACVCMYKLFVYAYTCSTVWVLALSSLPAFCSFFTLAKWQIPFLTESYLGKRTNEDYSLQHFDKKKNRVEIDLSRSFNLFGWRFRHRWSGMDPTASTCAAKSYFILQNHAEIDIICHRGWSWKIRSTLYGFAGSFPRPLPRRNYRKGDSRGRAPYAVPRAETCYDNSVYQYEDTNPTAMNN